MVANLKGIWEEARKYNLEIPEENKRSYDKKKKKAYT